MRAARMRRVCGGVAALALMLALASCRAQPSAPAAPPPGVPPPPTAAPPAGTLTPEAREPAPWTAPSAPSGPPSPYDGMPAPDAAALMRRPLAVMLDNHPDARPQTGLARAEVVYEMLAEGGITRLMAVFLRDPPDVVGPVRSARHYFVRTALEYDALYVHVGFSPQAKADIERFRVPSLDDARGAGGFFRIRERRSPHNLYVSLRQARAWAAARGWEKRAAPAASWRFQGGLWNGGERASRVRIAIPGAHEGYAVEYAFDPEKAAYLRSINGEPHVDAATGEQLQPRTVVVQVVPTRPVPGDAEGRLDMDIVGSGRARVFTRGGVIEARWRKPAATARTTFSDAAGEPIRLPPGQVWIQVVPPAAEVEAG